MIVPIRSQARPGVIVDVGKGEESGLTLFLGGYDKGPGCGLIHLEGIGANAVLVSAENGRDSNRDKGYGLPFEGMD